MTAYDPKRFKVRMKDKPASQSDSRRLCRTRISIKGATHKKSTSYSLSNAPYLTRVAALYLSLSVSSSLFPLSLPSNSVFYFKLLLWFFYRRRVLDQGEVRVPAEHGMMWHSSGLLSALRCYCMA